MDAIEILDRMIESLPPFKRVYQGGHHDVWCNGLMHRKTINAGGYCHDDLSEPSLSYLEYLCDCDEWSN
jgi:hypothetical protein